MIGSGQLEGSIESWDVTRALRRRPGASDTNLRPNRVGRKSPRVRRPRARATNMKGQTGDSTPRANRGFLPQGSNLARNTRDTVVFGWMNQVSFNLFLYVNTFDGKPSSQFGGHARTAEKPGCQQGVAHQTQSQFAVVPQPLDCRAEGADIRPVHH